MPTPNTEFNMNSYKKRKFSRNLAKIKASKSKKIIENLLKDVDTGNLDKIKKLSLQISQLFITQPLSHY